jgi:hypothetical protein
MFYTVLGEAAPIADRAAFKGLVRWMTGLIVFTMAAFVWAPIPFGLYYKKMTEPTSALAQSEGLLDEMPPYFHYLDTQRVGNGTVADIAVARPSLIMLADSRRGLAGFPSVIFKMNAAELAVLRGTNGLLTASANVLFLVGA